MRLRFTIRDLLWLTLLAAVLTAWWLDHRHLKSQIWEPFPPNITFGFGSGQQVHEKIEDLSPEERAKISEEVEQAKNQDAH